MKDTTGAGSTPVLDPVSRAHVDRLARFSQITDRLAIALEAAKLAIDAAAARQRGSTSARSCSS